MKLTIGMPCWDDYDGVVFTVKSLQMGQISTPMQNAFEILVVDNNPGSQQGQATAEFCASAGVRYVPFTDKVGTAPAKNKVFAEARGEAVLCIDSHVILDSAVIPSLLRWRPEYFDGLYHGPLILDNPSQCCIGLDGTWGSGMKGQWISSSVSRLPTNPIDIDAHGCGLMLCRKDQWQGFHPDFAGFGGEEWYIQNAFRKAGLRVRLMPLLKWWHRFRKPFHTGAPGRNAEKARNYHIGWKSLGLDVAEVKNHFVGELKMSEAEYANAIGEAAPATCTPCEERRRPMESARQAGLIPSWYAHLCERVDAGLWKSIHDIAGRYDSVSMHAVQIDDVACCVLASQCKTITWDNPPTGEVARMVDAEPNGKKLEYGQDRVPYGLRVVQQSSATPALAELQRNRETLVDLLVTGANLEDAPNNSGPGVRPAIRRFLEENPDWSVIEVSPHGFGAMLLSRNPERKSKLPSMARMAINYAKALARHAANGFEKVTEERHSQRLELCQLCPARVNDRCSLCGCPVEDKALWASESCPAGKW